MLEGIISGENGDIDRLSESSGRRKQRGVQAQSFSYEEQHKLTSRPSDEIIGGKMGSHIQLEVLAFTDPVCTWCWGSEPLLRKLEIWYGDQVKLRYVMGGLVKDIRAFYDSANDIGGDPEQSNLQIARHWLEASERHGMPVRTDGFRLFTAETVSTYPQNMAFKAAELSNPGLASRCLRRMREASAAEAMRGNSSAVTKRILAHQGVVADRHACISPWRNGARG